MNSSEQLTEIEIFDKKSLWQQNAIVKYSTKDFEIHLTSEGKESIRISVEGTDLIIKSFNSIQIHPIHSRKIIITNQI